jgi:hypothetical protein
MRAIYLVPVAAIALGAFGLARMLRRWRSGGTPPAPPTPAGDAPKDAYDTRLDDELKDLE